MKLLTIVALLTFRQVFGQNDIFEAKEANMTFQFPNREWRLESKDEDPDVISYGFKRNQISDNSRREIPWIIIYIEDASRYNRDLTKYTSDRRNFIQANEITVDKILTQKNKNYPISYQNSQLTMCSHRRDGFEHILYMINIINRDNKGITVYMDMTKDWEAEYVSEFWAIVRSIQEVK